MIQASDLRIGNKLFVEKCGIVDVLGIEQHSKDGDILYIWAPGMEFKHRVKLAEATSIPLTPEILEKAGFDGKIILVGEKCVCSYDWHLISYNSIVHLAYDYDDGAYHSHNAEHNYDIKHLHQLQNVYFALTGQELNINL